MPLTCYAAGMESAGTNVPWKRRRKRMRPRRVRPGHSFPLLGAIDLGTNNCRLLVASIDDKGRLNVVDSFSRIVRLGEGVDKTGKLSEVAMDRTIAALKICAQRFRRSRATKLRAIMTEAARRASNTDALIARAKREAGISLEVVSTEEEAHLAAVGCAPLIGQEFEGVIIFDIGGGSTEIIWAQGHGAKARTLCAASVPLGVVTLAERLGAPPSLAEIQVLASTKLVQVRKDFDSVGLFDATKHHLLGTSGTVTTLGGIALGLSRYDRAKVDGSWHEFSKIATIAAQLGALDLKGRSKFGCVGSDRADLIVPGCGILLAIHALWPCPKLRVADRGLREGMLREMAANSVIPGDARERVPMGGDSASAPPR